MNRPCEILGIDVPTVEQVKDHPDANIFALLLVALLESGEPMTLDAVATRLEKAGFAPRDKALASLKRCRPGRAPVYRDGDHYHIDPHDDDLDLWVFRLGLRPPRVARPVPEQAPVKPLPDSTVPLSNEELDEGWKNANLSSWSAQRLALAVLEAAGGPLSPRDVVSRVSALTREHRLRENAPHFFRKNSAVQILADGRWSIAEGAGDTLMATRAAVREKIAQARRYARPDPALLAAHAQRVEDARQERIGVLVRAKRAVFSCFPVASPRWLTVADLSKRELTTLSGDEISRAQELLDDYDIIAAVNVRRKLRALNVDPGVRRLVELRPPQATVTIDDAGNTIALTTAKLITGSCGIRAPLADPSKLATYLQVAERGEVGKADKLRARLEKNVTSLCALYQYGRLHGAARIRWPGYFIMLPVPWSPHDEPRLYHLKDAAKAAGVGLEIVRGPAPPWQTDPFEQTEIVTVESDARGWTTVLVDDTGAAIDETDIQLARIAAPLQ